MAAPEKVLTEATLPVHVRPRDLGTAALGVLHVPSRPSSKEGSGESREIADQPAPTEELPWLPVTPTFQRPPEADGKLSAHEVEINEVITAAQEFLGKTVTGVAVEFMTLERSAKGGIANIQGTVAGENSTGEPVQRSAFLDLRLQNGHAINDQWKGTMTIGEPVEASTEKP